MDALIIFRAVVALTFVLSLIGGFAWVAKRFGLLNQMNKRPGKQMQVIESLTLDPRHKIVMVKLGESTKAALLGLNSCQFLNEEIELAEIAEEELEAPAGRLTPRPEVLNWQQAIKSLRDKIYNIPEPAAPPPFKDQLENEIRRNDLDEARTA